MGQLTPRLSDHLRRGSPAERIEVILEMKAPPSDASLAATPPPASRSRYVTAQKEHFAAEVTALLPGCEVSALNWLTRTVKLIVAVGDIETLAQREGVALVDLPEALYED